MRADDIAYLGLSDPSRRGSCGMLDCVFNKVNTHIYLGVAADPHMRIVGFMWTIHVYVIYYGVDATGLVQLNRRYL